MLPPVTARPPRSCVELFGIFVVVVHFFSFSLPLGRTLTHTFKHKHPHTFLYQYIRCTYVHIFKTIGKLFCESLACGGRKRRYCATPGTSVPSVRQALCSAERLPGKFAPLKRPGIIIIVDVTRTPSLCACMFVCTTSRESARARHIGWRLNRWPGLQCTRCRYRRRSATFYKTICVQRVCVCVWCATCCCTHHEMHSKTVDCV